MKSVTVGLTAFVRAHSAAVARVAACAMLAVSTLAIPSARAFADPATPEAKPPARQYERLEKLLRREQNVLEREQKRLRRAGEIATKVQSYIDNQKAKGKNTSKLEAALADFKAAVASAQEDYNTAKRILDAKAGFDGNGKVVDPAQAKETVRTAGKAEQQFHRTMRKAVHQLRTAIRQYRHDNMPEREAAAPRGERSNELRPAA